MREICSKYGILLICDEIMAGFGRCAKWFAVDHWNVKPDIITAAKGINSGYLPLGVMAVSEDIHQWLCKHPLPGGLTYAGHPLACASGVAAIQTMQDENTLSHAEKMGKFMRRELHKLAQKHPSIGDIRGLGLFNGIELVKNRKTREALVPYGAKGEDATPMNTMMQFAMEQGLYLSFFSNIIRLTPPLNIKKQDLSFGLKILDKTLNIADRLYQD
ncbi:MAG: aminotransferase class III-fold pyridoxal phosphate-dependent enzyme [Pseudomonadota bacterium]